MGFRIGVGIGLLLCAAGAQTPPAPVWSYAGPAATMVSPALLGAALGGPLQALVLGSDGLTLYAGGMGGVWQYADGVWSHLGLAQPVSALANSNGILYAGTAAGLFTDASGTWQPLAVSTFAGLAINRIAVPDATQLLVGTSGGLYLSADGGTTWTRILTGEVWDVAVQGSTILAAAATNLEMSSDGGANFAAVGSTSGNRAALAFDGTRFLALVSGSPPALIAISNGGLVVPLVFPAQLSSVSADAMALASDGGDIWVGASDLWDYSNSLATWTNLTNASQPAAVIHAQQHAVLPASNGDLWLANDGGLWLRPQAASSFEDANLGLTNAAPLALALAASGTLMPLAGGGLATASSSGWSIADPAGYFSAVATDPAATASVFAVDRATGALWRASDASLAWTSVSCSTDAVTALAAAPGLPWTGTSQGELFDPVCQAFHPPVNGDAISALALAGNSLWLATAEGVWNSANSGVTWAQVTVPFAGTSALALYPATPGTVAAAAPTGVYLSFNAGAAWVALPNGLPAAAITGLAFDANETLWATTLGHGLWSLPVASAAFSVQIAASQMTAMAGSTIQLTATLTQLGGPAIGAALVLSASGTGWSQTLITGANGTASASFTLPQNSGTIEFLAAAGSASASTSVSVTPGPPAQIIVVSGDNQSAVEGTVLLQPIVLELADQYGNPISGQTLAVSGTGSFGPVAPTDTAGRTSLRYTLPMAATGPVVLTASDGAVQSTWVETALITPSYALVLSAPSAPVLPNQLTVLTLQVQAVGGYSQVVPVVCAVPIPGCTVSPATVAPGGSATVDVDIGAFDADATTVTVTLESDSAHTASATLAVEGFTLTANAATLAVDAGATTEPLALTLTSVNGFTGAITLAVTQSDGTALPASLVPLFTPSTVALAATPPATANFTIAVAAASSVPSWPGFVLGLFLLAMALRVVPRNRRLAWAVGALALAATACGGGGSISAPPSPVPVPPSPTVTTYNLQITATSNGLQQTAPLTLTVTAP